MNFTINLATRIYIDTRKLNLFMGALALLLGIWLLLALYSVIDNAGQMRKFSEQKTKLAAKTSTVKVSDADYAGFLARVKTVNTILLKKSYDWLALFDNLERLVPAGVALRGLEPVDKGESLKISAAALNFPAIRNFVEALEASKEFTDIYLTEQSNLKEANRLKGINFTITCKARRT